jgi:hypothetical protein
MSPFLGTVNYNENQDALSSSKKKSDYNISI